MKGKACFSRADLLSFVELAAVNFCESNLGFN
jgi:hypothetical protein